MPSRTVLSRSTAAIAAVSLLLLRCSNSSGPATPAAVEIAPSAVTLGAIGSTQQLTATVKDANGATISGAKVTWSSNNTGIATVSSTGNVVAVGAGTTQIDATASGSSVKGSVTVSVAQVAAQIVKFSGDNQTDTVGQLMPAAIVIQVQDSTGHPVGNVSVGFTVTAGGGSVTTTSTTTGAGGLASTPWRLGTTTGLNQATASAATGTSTPVVFSATAVAGKPKSVQAQSGDAQTGPAGTVLANPVVVVVHDTFNNAVSGAVVQFAVTNGGGKVGQPTATTNASGQGSMTWTLGSAGTNNLTATVTGSGISGNPVTFSATATANGTPKSVAVSSGNGQTGLATFALNVPPAVIVGDSLGHPVAGAEVTFAVTSGGGSVTKAVDTTDVFGVATVGSWSVNVGSNGLSATVTGSGISGNPAGFTATGVNAGYKVDIRFISTMTSAESLAFLSAKTKWESIVYQPVAAVNLSNVPAGTCGSGTPAIDTTGVTSVVIFASIVPIDGPGKILAEAGPCLIRNTGFLPALGIMMFDSADVGGLGSSLSDVILHEMGHVLGYGTIWDPSLLNLIQNPCGSANPCTSDPSFTGAQATAAFFKVGGSVYTGGAIIPVENTGGPGTADGHWRETVFKSELMTGFYNVGVNPLSVVSIASMGDLGYTVNYAAADNYVLSWPLLATPLTQTQLQHDILRIPITLIDVDGRAVRVVMPR